MPGGTSSKRKGYVYETRTVADLRENGIPARRVPASGSAKDFPGDVDMSEAHLIGEVKYRRKENGFWTTRKWLGTKDVLFLRSPLGETLVVVRFSLFTSLLRVWQGALKRE